MKNQKYQPIDCNFYDVLLDKATRKSLVVLEYEYPSGRVRKEEVIKDVYTKDSEEFLLTESGLTIRLDQILSIDGENMPIDSFCHNTSL